MAASQTAEGNTTESDCAAHFPLEKVINHRCGEGWLRLLVTRQLVISLDVALRSKQRVEADFLQEPT